MATSSRVEIEHARRTHQNDIKYDWSYLLFWCDLSLRVTELLFLVHRRFFGGHTPLPIYALNDL